MALVLAILAFALVLGVSVRSSGPWVYTLLFLFALMVAIAYKLLYYRLFF